MSNILTIKVNLDTAAIREWGTSEINNVLMQVSPDTDEPLAGQGGMIHDSNGQACGLWTIGDK